MFILLAVLAFAAAWIEHIGKIIVEFRGFDQQGLLYLGLFFLAVHLLRKHGGIGGWRSG